MVKISNTFDYDCSSSSVDRWYKLASSQYDFMTLCFLLYATSHPGVCISLTGKLLIAGGISLC